MLRSEGYRTAGVVSNWVISRKNGFAQGFDLYNEGAAALHQAATSQGVTRAARGMLDSFASEALPFFLFVHYFDPHYRYLSHEEVDIANGEVGRIAEHPSIFQVRKLGPELSAEEVANLRDLYAEEVRHTDGQVGFYSSDTHRARLRPIFFVER